MTKTLPRDRGCRYSRTLSLKLKNDIRRVGPIVDSSRRIIWRESESDIQYQSASYKTGIMESKRKQAFKSR